MKSGRFRVIVHPPSQREGVGGRVKRTLGDFTPPDLPPLGGGMECLAPSKREWAERLGSGILFVLAWLPLPVAAGEPAPPRQQALIQFLKQDCGSCHGMTLQGGLGPALLPEALSAKPDDVLITTILKGRSGTAMPPWESFLSRDEAAWLVAQLRAGLKSHTP